MYLFFLGIVKNLLLDIMEWVSLRNKSFSLRNHFLLKTKKLKNFYLIWIKIESFVGDKLGGWVSENYTAFARISVWCFVDIDSVKKDPLFILPNKPISQ